MTLEEIRDIVRVIKKYEIAAQKPLSFNMPSSDESRISRFYQILLDDIVSSDQEAIKNIYGEQPSLGKYKTLKSYFAVRAINNIAFLDFTGTSLSQHTRAIYKCYKYLFAISVLLALGSRSGAIRLSRKILKLATKYEFHTIIIDLLDRLKTHSFQIGNTKDYDKYQSMLDERINILAIELKIKSLEQRTTIVFAKSLFVEDKIRMDAQIALKEIRFLMQKADTFLGRLSYYRLLYLSDQIEGYPIKSVEACDQAIAFMLENKHMSPPSRFAEFALYKLENYVLARDYENGRAAVKYCEEHINTGMNLWFTVKEYEFLLMMQTVNFDNAVKIYNDVIRHDRYNTQLEHLREKWDIFGLYVDYLVHSGLLNSSTEQKEIPFRKSNLLRTKRVKQRLVYSPTYSKDKRGFNVALLVMNVLILLESNKKDLLIEQTEALSTYRFSYLNQNHCKQSFILFKLIRLMIRNEFDLTKISKKCVDIEKSLRSAPLVSGELLESIQILPPSWVWSRMKTILANKQ
ncbi:MAG: hypothetical protein ABI778_01160 [Ignavibacteriota bacterium]